MKYLVRIYKKKFKKINRTYKYNNEIIEKIEEISKELKTTSDPHKQDQLMITAFRLINRFLKYYREV